MNRKKRTELLSYCSLQVLESLTKKIKKKYIIKTIEEPNTGLVMIKMRESAQKSLFYLGEVFVTECKVMIGDSIGIGIIKGYHPKKVYELAIIDAAYKENLEDVKELTKRLNKIEVKILNDKKKEIAQILKTKVEFETLDEEVKA